MRTTQCHRRGREIDRFHGFDRPIRLRRLPVFGRCVVVEIRPKRYRCSSCEWRADDHPALLEGHGHDVAVVWARTPTGKTTCWRCCRTP